jgi:hypothetical protein
MTSDWVVFPEEDNENEASRTFFVFSTEVLKTLAAGFYKSLHLSTG